MHFAAEKIMQTTSIAITVKASDILRPTGYYRVVLTIIFFLNRVTWCTNKFTIITVAGM